MIPVFSFKKMKPIQAEIILNSGKIASVKKIEGSTIIINEKGRYEYPDCWIYPGLVDSHGHIFGLGQILTGLDFSACFSEDECIQKALKFTEYRGDWLFGRGWNQELWSQNFNPSLEKIDEAFPNIPVYFVRVDGHAAWVNSKALKLAGIDRNTPDPVGGSIIRDKSGHPNGLLIDNAMELVSGLIPRMSKEQVKEKIISAQDILIQSGLTEIHDMDMHPEIFHILNELNQEGKLKLRIQGFLKAQNEEYLSAINSPYMDDKLNIIGLKFYADGALGSRGALLFDEYLDAPGKYGLELLTQSELFKKSKIGIEKGFAIAVHSIGDKANYNVLQVYQKLRNEKVASQNEILRIEHAQIIRPQDFDLFAKNNVFAAVQPVHCLSDAKMARARTGERINNSYPWSSLIDNGVVIGGGSDFPIETYDPLIGINAFIHRIPFNEEETWIPEQRISPEEALNAYTIGAHKLSGNEKLRGTISEGMDGDLTILNRNICQCNNEELLTTQVKGVFINSELIY